MSANTTNSPSDPKSSAKEDQSYNLRRQIAQAYAFVKGQESVQSFSALTIEECIDRDIEETVGTHPDGRPNRLERVDAILMNLVTAVSQVKSLPDSFFVPHDEKTDVNTAPVPPAAGH